MQYQWNQKLNWVNKNETLFSRILYNCSIWAKIFGLLLKNNKQILYQIGGKPRMIIKNQKNQQIATVLKVNT